MKIGSQDIVKLTALISDAYTGDVLAENTKDEPFAYHLVNNEVLRGLAEELVGKEQGYKFDIVLTPEMAFGEHDPEKLRVLLKKECPEDIAPGVSLCLKLPSGEEDVYVKEVHDNKVVVDSNPPLVGLTVRVRGEVLSFN